MDDAGIGPLLRRLRLAAGRSQSEQADLLAETAGRPVTRHEVSRWENESRLITPYWQARYATSYGIPVVQLRRAVAVSKARRRLQRAEPSDGEDSVQRRQFIGTMARLAAALPAAPLPAAGRRINQADAQHLLDRTARLRRLDDYLGGADTYQLYAAELAATTTLIRDASYAEATSRALLSVLAEQAQLAGWAAFDAGFQTEAKQHYLTSLSAARDAGSAMLAGNSLAFLAYQQVSTTRPSIELATASYDTAKHDASPRVRALLLERLAWTHAVAGNPTETDRALAQATEAITQAATEPEPDWVFWVDDQEIQIMAGRCWIELHRPLRAVPTLEAVLARYDDTHARDKALYLTWLAHAYLDAREIERAAEVTGRAIDLATGVASARPTTRIGKVIQRLKPHHRVPAAAAVIDRFQSRGR
jgi:transcriptional regulator with XRE-family HTH domain